MAISVSEAKTEEVFDRPTVYFIQAGDGGPIKIGVARNVRQRLRLLQVGNAHRLTLLGVHPGGVNQERRLHRLFGDARISGEWFEPTAELLEFVQTHVVRDWWRAEGLVAPTRKGRISKLEPVIVAWVVGRAGQFYEDGWPCFSYGKISRNLWKSRRVRLSSWQVKRLLQKVEPKLLQRRSEAFKRSSRKVPERGAV